MELSCWRGRVGIIGFLNSWILGFFRYLPDSISC
jgi:hypothetical protein